MRPFTTSTKLFINKLWKGMQGLPWWNEQAEEVIKKHPKLSKKATRIEFQGRPHESDKDPLHITAVIRGGEHYSKYLTTMHLYADKSVHFSNKDYREQWEKQERMLAERAAADADKDKGR